MSNGSDAGDKLRFEAMSDPALFEADPEPKIRVSYDADARTITVSDNGIGMSRQEVVEHIGTIAKSGTREFFAQLTSDRAKDAHLIGQFGVGFYSSFIVADRVTLITRRAGLTADHGVRWESSGEGDYTVETVRKETRGTDVILHLRPEEDELLSGMRLREILRKYSDHITLPILMKKEQWDSNAKKQIQTADDEQINQASALWARPKSEISRRAMPRVLQARGPRLRAAARLHTRQGRRPAGVHAAVLHPAARADRPVGSRAPARHQALRPARHHGRAEQLLPPYLRFVRGIVDSNDLPLNVSREILQQSRDVQTIRNASVKRVLSLIEDLAKDQADTFTTFWKAFGRVLKEGAADDAANRERIAKLLRYASTKSDTTNRTSRSRTMSRG